MRLDILFAYTLEEILGELDILEFQSIKIFRVRESGERRATDSTQAENLERIVDFIVHCCICRFVRQQCKRYPPHNREDGPASIISLHLQAQDTAFRTFW
jgi:hypothetical protein